MKKISKIWLISLFATGLLLLYVPVNAQEDLDKDSWWEEHVNDLEVNSFNILPELTSEEITDLDQKIDEIWKTWWNVMKEYNATADKLTTSEQLASWIMNWSTITDYLAYIVKFLSQIWLIVWAMFIIYAWYKYMVSVFSWWKVPTETLKNAIIWIVIIVFSYAIMKALTSLVWIT